MEAIINNHYVDDYLDSFPTMEDAAKTIKQITQIHDRANFFIRNFVSNSDQLIKLIAEERRPENEILTFSKKDENYEKIIGMHWDARQDQFRYKLKIPTEELGKMTKRKILSNVMRIYDPLGLVINLTTEAKILMQELWKEKVGLDETLPIDLLEK